MEMTTKNYESKLPITHKELFQMAKKITVEDLRDEWLDFYNTGERYKDNELVSSITLNQHGCEGHIVIYHPEESDKQIEIIEINDPCRKILRLRLSRLLDMELQEIPQEVPA
ncbi:hypothetical protein HOE04_05060 [archaeon]|jgi:hypothetical protein|nr:hypothetical protein [archaeon]